MARHRSGDREPRTGSWPAALDAPATGPRPYGGRHRGDPATTPLDLAAIARAAAEAREGTAEGRPGRQPWTVADAGRQDGAPRTSAAAPHRAARAPRAKALTPTRAAGALALFGALAGASVAAASTGPAFLADPPADTGELARPDTLAVAPAGVSGAVAPQVVPRTTASAPSTTAPVPPQPDDGRTLWSADFRTAGLSNFRSTPWNNQGAKAPVLSDGVLDFTMPGGGKRSEVEPNFADLTEGDVYYFGFSVRLAPDFPVNTPDWQVITQFKNEGTGTPPLELKVQDGVFLVDGDGGAFRKTVGEAIPGRWTHIVLKVKFSSSDGEVSAWQDGVQRFVDYAPPSGTLYAGKVSYLKTGIYRSTSIRQPGKLSFGSWAIGTSLGSVSKDLPAGAD